MEREAFVAARAADQCGAGRPIRCGACVFFVPTPAAADPYQTNGWCCLVHQTHHRGLFCPEFTAMPERAKTEAPVVPAGPRVPRTGAELKAWREAQGLTVRDAAELLGMAHATYGRREAGGTLPDETVTALAGLGEGKGDG